MAELAADAPATFPVHHAKSRSSRLILSNRRDSAYKQLEAYHKVVIIDGNNKSTGNRKNLDYQKYHMEKARNLLNENEEKFFLKRMSREAKASNII